MQVLQEGDPGLLGVKNASVEGCGRRRRGMTPRVLLTCVGLLAAAVASVAPPAVAAEALERPPAVAGRFYPGEAKRLEAAVKAYLAEAVEPSGPRPVALVAPHAGYIYSGQIAADAYRQAMGHDYDLVVILGANHTSRAFDGVSVYDGKGYRTPLGLAELDREVLEKLIAAEPRFRFNPSVHQREHSVEVHVPFVQVAFPEAKIVTAVVGRPSLELCARFGKALARAVKGRRALIVASTDLSHYPGYDDAVTADLGTLEAATRLDPAKFREVILRQSRSGVPGLSTCACGEAPLLAAMEAARHLGADHARIVSYANSGDTSVGDPSRVVGYGAAVFSARAEDAGDETVDRTPGWRPRASRHEGELTADEKRELLVFARESIRRRLETGTAPLARFASPALWREQGVFVTLKTKGQGRLRGCMGHKEADRPLGQIVGAMAMRAAFDDPRFNPLSPEELDKIEIDISLLSPLKLVQDASAVVVGRDGVFLQKQGRGALYLPEVAVEQRWNRDTMLDNLCRKARLPAGAWREGAELYTFQTVALHESDF
jgi:AmmeMemoRadiSam system protein B/AmmeMemoRadiSam system protein A